MHRGFWLLLLALLAFLFLFNQCGEASESDAPGPQAAPQKSEPVKVADTPKVAEGPHFVDIAKELGLTRINSTGEEGKKQFIMSAIGPGAALFDADGDGRLDIYVPDGTKLMPPFYESLYDGPDRPRNALYMQQPDGTFRNEAKERGVDCDRWGFGATAADVDNDGDPDLLVANFSQNRLYLNDGKGRFRDVAELAGIAGVANKWSTCIAVGDLNLDGLPDLYVANYADMFKWIRESDSVRRNERREVIDAATCDWHRLEVYCGPKGLPRQQDHLYYGTGVVDGVPRFEEVTKQAGVARPGTGQTRMAPGYGFQVLIGDLSADGWPDIFVSNDSTYSYYFENKGDGTFHECGEERGIAASAGGDDLAGMGADFGDINRDGYFDIIKTNFALETFNLYIADLFKGRMDWIENSMRSGMDKDVHAALGWGALLFDYDHDGDLDIFFANGHVYPEVDQVPDLGTRFKQYNQLFRNMTVENGAGSRLRVKHMTQNAGPGFQVLESTRGASFGDLDEDGDLDLVLLNLNAPPTVLRNERGSKQGHWLHLRLIGDPKRGVTRDAYHTLVKVENAAGTQYFQANRARGFLGSCDPRLHVGLGKSKGKVKLTITWPNKEVQVIETEELNRVLEVRQDSLGAG
ncbi:MAG: CRTAC1 family protein [Planctomycetota bacterium]